VEQTGNDRSGDVTSSNGEGSKARRTLEQKRAELREAEQALSSAEARYDQVAVVRLEREVEALRRFVERLNVEAMDELETAGAEAAGRWLAESSKELDGIAARVGKAQEEARQKVAEAVRAIEGEMKLRREAERHALAGRILAMRFPDAAASNGRQPVKLPDLADHARPVLVAMDKFATRPLRPPTVGRRPVDTDQQRRARVLRGLKEWLGTHGRVLPAAVQNILSGAPIPQSATIPPPDTPGQSGGVSEAQAIAASGIQGAGRLGAVHRG
jgi:hypothetical protein